MTRNYYVTGNYEVDHSTFGGEIEIEDFNTYSPNKKRINNQIDAINLPKIIKNKQNKKDEEKKYKNMTLEEIAKKEHRSFNNLMVSILYQYVENKRD